MKIGIIGAGFTGLSAAFYLQKSGHEVTVFEKDKNPGGLALGFKKNEWNWTLEEHYHHFFTNDDSILDLAKEINFPVLTRRPKTSVFLQNKIYQLDSPLKLLQFSQLSLAERIHMAVGLGFLRYNPFWKPFEKITASRILPYLMGKNAYKLIWEPQLKGKFGTFTDIISLAWFWARVKKRTTSLSYPQGGFLELAKHLQKEIEKMGGKFHYNTEVSKLKSQNSKVKIAIQNSKIETHEFDLVIVTLPSFLFIKITEGLPDSYIKNLNKLQGIGAINLVLRLKNNFFDDNTYWLSVCDKSFPFGAIVEHTNYMDKKNYNDEHLVYIGKYLPSNHEYFKMEKNELLKSYDPYLKKINPNYEKSLIDFEVFKSPFAQPIIPINYSKLIPKFETPLENVYLANIEQVYPWDRGTNYAVELGKKIATAITTN